MASVTYGKRIMASVIMAKVLWQMKLSPCYYAVTSQGYFPKWQLPKCALPIAATSQICPSHKAWPVTLVCRVH